MVQLCLVLHYKIKQTYKAVILNVLLMVITFIRLSKNNICDISSCQNGKNLRLYVHVFERMCHIPGNVLECYHYFF